MTTLQLSATESGCAKSASLTLARRSASGSSCLTRVWATSLLLILTVGIAAAQAFGRFGYTDIPVIPGFTIDKGGFVANYGAAEKFYFSQPASDWKVTHASDVQEQINLGAGAGPSNLAVNLLAPGFMLRFSKGFELHFRSTSAPYLSWKEASVGEHVPTPNVRWIAVSFKVAQPPIVLGFLGDDVSLQLDGNVGDWTLHSLKPYSGWVRVALPDGTRPLATDSAASLGQLTSWISGLDAVWWQPAPKLESLTITDEATAIEATWNFDRKGAVVPSGATLANLGAYPLSIKSQVQRLQGYTEEGPMTICKDKSLTIRFPINRVPLGRAVTVGTPELAPIATVSAFDLSGVVDLAMENLLAARDLRTRNTAEDAVNELIQNVQYSVEPHTNQRLPFSADGKGTDVLAGNALLYQACMISTKPSSQENSLLTSVGWRRDWYSWKIWTPDEKISRRAGALSAMAGALCPEPERRLDAAMAQAGLAADRGLGIFLQRASGSRVEPKYLEPLWTVRNTIFDMAQTPRHPSAFATTLLGDVRIFGDTPVQCSGEPAKGFQIAWSDPNSITLASGFPIMAAGDGVVSRHILGYTSIKSLKPGDHTANILFPPWAQSLLRFVAPPVYDEPIN